jgi:hypothetical protein
VRLTTTTTYIGKDGKVAEVKCNEQVIYYETVLPQKVQIATIKDIGEGMKITVTRLETNY